jgi:UDP:flavonoid glycosyltransferase YjiC (YdhE family)
MRILFSFAGGSGHMEPLTPLARAAQAAGHVVAFAGQPAMQAAIEAAGFAAFDTAGATVGDTPERLPLLKLDMEREEGALRDGYAGRIARERAASLLELCAAWRPDVIVRDEVDFGSAVAAERLGLPCATVLVIAAGSFVRPALVAEPLNRLRAAHGLPADPALAMLSRDLVLAPFPPSYRDPAYPLPATAHSFRPQARPVRPGAGLPAWAAYPQRAPLVYFTLGTVFNIESGDLFQRVLAGLRELPINLIVTLGREIDPAELGPQPANVRVARYIPQACRCCLSQWGPTSR